ncbi:MAG: MMPL family transporter [Bacteroidia bacterium]
MLKRFLTIAMLVLLVITGMLVWSCRNLEFDYNFEHFFPVESDDAEFFYDYRQKFGSDNEFIIIALRNQPDVFRKSFLDSVQLVTDSMRSIKGVRSVNSIINLKLPVINSFGMIEVPVLRMQSDSALQQSAREILADSLLTGNFVSAGGQSLAIYLRHEEQLKKSTGDSLLTALETLCEASFPDRWLITGKLKSERAYLNKTRNELILFMSVSFVLVTLFLWFTFRNVWGVLVPLTVVILAIIWTIGIMAVTGKAIDIMIILMPCILFVVGMSDVIHITSQFYEKIEEGFDKITAIRLSLEEVGFATFLTCISTSIAFLTLNTTSIQPVRDFGTYTAIGVVAAYILSITVLPFILIQVKNPDRFRVHNVQVRWDRFLRRIIRGVFKYPVQIVAGTVILTIIAFVGIGRIEVNNSVLDDLDENDPIKQEFKFFDKEFGGVRGFEMQVNSASPDGLFSPESVAELLEVERYLKNEYKVSVLVSPLDVLRGFNRSVHDGDSQFFSLPADEAEIKKLVRRLKPWLQQKEIKALISPDMMQGRFSGRIRDKGSRAVGVKNDAFEKHMRELNPEHIDWRITGSSDLIDKSNEYLTDNMLQGLSLDIIALMIIVGLIFRSWRMMTISVIPNVIPLALIAGLIGWAGIEMKVTISIIFSIAFGIAVDDTLHLLSRLKVELNKGMSLYKALLVTYLSTGKAMILTAMVIAAGFSTLMLSNFKSTFYVGMLISMTLLFALIAELILMPVLLMWIYRKKNAVNRVINKQN